MTASGQKLPKTVASIDGSNASETGRYVEFGARVSALPPIADQNCRRLVRRVLAEAVEKVGWQVALGFAD